MNRRDFIKAAFTLLGAPYLPNLLIEARRSGEWITLNAVRRSVELMKANAAPDSYFMFVPPSVFNDLVKELTPREAWKLAHRQARIELKRMALEVIRVGRIGSYEKFRFVEG